MKYLNILLLFAPVAIIGHLFFHWPPTLLFAASALAVIPAAGLLGQATEELAVHTGPRLGGLLNATLGNAAELIITIFAIRAGLLELVKASITGSILGNVLLIMGFSVFLGGAKNGPQRFGRTSAGVNATQLMLSVLALVIPSLFFFAHTETEGPVEWLSLGTAGIMLVIYLLGLIFAFRFTSAEPDLAHETQVQHHGGWPVWQSIALLLGSTVLIAWLSEILVGTVEHTVADLGVSEFFIGIIVVPLVGNVAEHTVAVQAAWKNKMELSMAVSLGSSLQIALFVAPVLVFLSLFMGHPLTLVFNQFEIIALFGGILIAGQVFQDGETNWLEGAQLLGVYVILALAFFFPEGLILRPEITYTISQITGYIKSLFASDALMGDLWLSGEVSNFTQAASGHCYFTLKDAKSGLKSVIWRTAAASMILPQNGDQVIAHGYVSVYEQAGAYQFYVNHLEPAGVGQLWQAFERLKAQLAAEGLFDDARKRPLPGLPVRLGLVTSATAAALRDVLRTLTSRYPLVDVILAPTLVQGDAAPPGIVAAIETLNRWSADREPLDAIIVARGGGSIEELWALNDERVARAIAASAVPVISGVGHETDVTIADFVADVRAPTPTGAAMMAVPDRLELRDQVTALVVGAGARMRERLVARRVELAANTSRLARVSPAVRLAADRQHVDDLTRRAELAIVNRLSRSRQGVSAQQLRLGALNPTSVLARGYAIVTDASGQVVGSAGQVAAGDRIHIQVADGAFDAKVDE